MPHLPEIAVSGPHESESDTPSFAWLESPNDDGTRVYLSVIRMPRPTRELLLAQGIPAARLDPALQTLAERGLVILRSNGVIEVPPPLPALTQHALLLERRASAARAAADSLSRIYNASRTSDSDLQGGLEILTDLEHVGSATNEAVALAEHTIRCLRGMTARTLELMASPLPSHREPTIGAGGRRVQMLTVWDTQVLEMPGALTALSARRDGGEIQRSMTNLPLSVVIVDDTTCIVEWSGEGKGPQGLKGHARGAVLAGLATFERFWQLGTPVGDDAGGELDARDAMVLRLMAAGVTDAAIARQTGFSQRTVERRVRHVMERLGAQTRFQAGVQAVHRGWL
ncbi:MAG TPA: helix-turn-helix transcriptional regulator [Lapillicoccus sp.]|nr:helix-turn-helix transcriptional regulator [Lapillicoccus sp.]